MRCLLLVGCLLWGGTAWADYTVTPEQLVDLTGLTNEVKRSVPSLEGLHEDRPSGTVTFRRLGGGAFTPDEEQALVQALQGHDATKARDRRRSESEETEIPLESFGAGVAGALAALGGKNLIIRVKKKVSPG